MRPNSTRRVRATSPLTGFPASLATLVSFFAIGIRSTGQHRPAVNQLGQLGIVSRRRPSPALPQLHLLDPFSRHSDPFARYPERRGAYQLLQRTAAMLVARYPNKPSSAASNSRCTDSTSSSDRNSRNNSHWLSLECCVRRPRVPSNPYRATRRRKYAEPTGTRMGRPSAFRGRDAHWSFHFSGNACRSETAEIERIDRQRYSNRRVRCPAMRPPS